MSDFRPRKRFGQHFLTDTNILQKIIRTIHPTEKDHMVEIGPGQGALTRYLVPAVGKLDAIEIDRDLITYLTDQFRNFPQFVLHQSDILKFDVGKLTDVPHSLRIVGNLPYNISTPLLFHLFDFAPLIIDIHVMLQKEVADRITAKVGGSNYGRLSVMTQYFCHCEHLFDVSAQCFSPPPQVESTVIRLTPYQTRPQNADNLELFSEIVKQAFNMRRKTIRNSLKKFFSADELQALDIDPQKRPQELTLAEYIRLSNSR